MTPKQLKKREPIHPDEDEEDRVERKRQEKLQKKRDIISKTLFGKKLEKGNHHIFHPSQSKQRVMISVGNLREDISDGTGLSPMKTVSERSYKTTEQTD